MIDSISSIGFKDAWRSSFILDLFSFPGILSGFRQIQISCFSKDLGWFSSVDLCAFRQDIGYVAFKKLGIDCRARESGARHDGSVCVTGGYNGIDLPVL